MLQSLRIEERILRSAAHLVAAIEDPRFGIKGMPSVLSDEVRDSIEMLRADLDEIGLLEPYRREGGTLGVW